MAFAISSGVPNLPSGTMLIIIFRRLRARFRGIQQVTQSGRVDRPPGPLTDSGQRPRPIHETDEWLWESATEFAALDRYAGRAMEIKRAFAPAARRPRAQGRTHTNLKLV
jgi:hypothetical protein